MKYGYPDDHEVNKWHDGTDWISPKCAEGHHGNSGPYCEECQDAESAAFQRIIALRELNPWHPDFISQVIELLKEPLF